MWKMLTAIGTIALATIGGISLVYAIVQFRDFRTESRIEESRDVRMVCHLVLDGWSRCSTSKFRTEQLAPQVETGRLAGIDKCLSGCGRRRFYNDRHEKALLRVFREGPGGFAAEFLPGNTARSRVRLRRRRPETWQIWSPKVR
jgi:hypothetical protein